MRLTRQPVSTMVTEPAGPASATPAASVAPVPESAIPQETAAKISLSPEAIAMQTDELKPVAADERLQSGDLIKVGRCAVLQTATALTVRNFEEGEQAKEERDAIHTMFGTGRGRVLVVVMRAPEHMDPGTPGSQVTEAGEAVELPSAVEGGGAQ